MGQILRFWPASATISTDNLDLEELCSVVNLVQQRRTTGNSDDDFVPEEEDEMDDGFPITSNNK